MIVLYGFGAGFGLPELAMPGPLFVKLSIVKRS